MEWVQLVDEQDNEIGVEEKIEAHRAALLHRAVSVFVFNTKGELLLQQRAATKYHSSSLWTNTCCTHPRPQELLKTAAERRLQEEMGMSVDLAFSFSFVYKAQLDAGLTEHEYDHVFLGTSDVVPRHNTVEVASWRYLSLDKVEDWMQQKPEEFTEWFKLIFERIKQTVS